MLDRYLYGPTYKKTAPGGRGRKCSEEHPEKHQSSNPEEWWQERGSSSPWFLTAEWVQVHLDFLPTAQHANGWIKAP